MKALPFVFVALGLPASAFAQYKPDWTYQNFYQALNNCRSAVVFPAAMDYAKKARAAGDSDDKIRNDQIAITPLSEQIASTMCTCALSELAKDLNYATYKADNNAIAGYVKNNRCSEATAAVIRGMSRDKADELKLK